MRLRLRLGVSLTFLCVIAACSGPPAKEHDQATAAVTTAKAGDAPTYAPEELAAAETALHKYDDAVAQRDYRQALNLALQARDHAYDAIRIAADQRAAAEKQAQALASELEGLVKTATARLAPSAQPHLTAQAAERLRAAAHAAPAALQEARAAINEKSYQTAVRRLTPVVETLRKELAPSETGRRGGAGLK